MAGDFCASLNSSRPRPYSVTGDVESSSFGGKMASHRGGVSRPCPLMISNPSAQGVAWTELGSQTGVAGVCNPTSTKCERYTKG